MYFRNYHSKPILNSAANREKTRDDINYDIFEDLKFSLGMLNGILKPANKTYKITPVSKFIYHIKITGIKDVMVAEKNSFWRSAWKFTMNDKVVRLNDVYGVNLFLMQYIDKISQVEYWLSSYDPTAWASDDSRKYFYAEGCLSRVNSIYKEATTTEQKKIMNVCKKYKLEGIIK
jgi:hypothetical protein